MGAHQFLSTPCWFRITRRGSTFTAYESGDGLSWTEVLSKEIPMDKVYYVGVFSESVESWFDHLSVE